MAASGNRSFDRARQLLGRHISDGGGLGEFELLGLSWDILQDVFCPAYTPVTGLFTHWLEYPVGGSFLEVGSGAGVTAVWAALQGCRTVTALDINSAAVENTRKNAVRHGMQDIVVVLESDLFSALPASAKFDLIYWNSNFVEPPPGFINRTGLQHALFDPGYSTHWKFLAQATGHLAVGGRLFLGFSDLGNWSLLLEAAASANLVPEIAQSERRDLEVSIEFQLVEFRIKT